MEVLQILEGLAYVGFIAGAIFAVIELRSLSKSRKTDLMLRFNEHWSSKEFQEALLPLREMFEAGATKVPSELEKRCSKLSLWMTLEYVEGIADLARDNLIDRKWVLNFLAWEGLWEGIQPWIEEKRKTTGNPTIGASLEWAAKVQKGYGT